MAVRLFRCQQQRCSEDPAGRLIFDFAVQPGDKVACPKCGADPSKPEFANIVIALEVIHLLVSAPDGPLVGRGGRYRFVCDPGRRNLGERGWQASGEPRAVNCPVCKESPEYKTMHEENLFSGTAPHVVDLPDEK